MIECHYDLAISPSIFRTFRQECPAHITLKISSDGQSVMVRSFSNEHNQEISLVKVCEPCICKAFTVPLPHPGAIQTFAKPEKIAS